MGLTWNLFKTSNPSWEPNKRKLVHNFSWFYILTEYLSRCSDKYEFKKFIWNSIFRLLINTRKTTYWMFIYVHFLYRLFAFFIYLDKISISKIVFTGFPLSYGFNSVGFTYSVQEKIFQYFYKMYESCHISLCFSKDGHFVTVDFGCYGNVHSTIICEPTLICEIHSCHKIGFLWVLPLYYKSRYGQWKTWVMLSKESRPD